MVLGRQGTSGGQRPKAREAYQTLRKAIVYGELAGGAFLNEGDLAAQLKMSRTPIREALSRLSKDRLVDLVPGRGAFVRDVSLADLRDIYELRKVLECFAAEEAVTAISDEDIAEIELAWLKIRDLVQQGEEVGYEAVSRLDSRFHSLLIDNCANTRLQDFMHLLNQEILRYQLVTARTLGDVGDTVEQHLRLIRLLKSRETVAFVDELRRHIIESETILLSRGRAPGELPATASVT
jgi:DNA-binding GntR family transcriptional regulator